MKNKNDEINKLVIIIPIVVFTAVLLVLIVSQKMRWLNKKSTSLSDYSVSDFSAEDSDAYRGLAAGINKEKIEISQSYVSKYSCSVYDGYEESKKQITIIPSDETVLAEAKYLSAEGNMIRFDYGEYRDVWAFEVYFREADSSTEMSTVNETATAESLTFENHDREDLYYYIGLNVRDIKNIFGKYFRTESFISPDNVYMYYDTLPADIRFWHSNISAVYSDDDIIDKVDCTSSGEKVTLYQSYTNKIVFSEIEKYIDDYEDFEAFGEISIFVDDYIITYKFDDNPLPYDTADLISVQKNDY